MPRELGVEEPLRVGPIYDPWIYIQHPHHLLSLQLKANGGRAWDRNIWVGEEWPFESESHSIHQWSGKICQNCCFLVCWEKTWKISVIFLQLRNKCLKTPNLHAKSKTCIVQRILDSNKQIRSSAQGNCSAKSLAASVMSSILPCSSILPGPPCPPPVMLSAEGGSSCGGSSCRGDPTGGRGSQRGERGWRHFIHLAMYCTTTWCFALKGLRTIIFVTDILVIAINWSCLFSSRVVEVDSWISQNSVPDYHIHVINIIQRLLQCDHEEGVSCKMEKVTDSEIQLLRSKSTTNKQIFSLFGQITLKGSSKSVER